jgi:hypothetical protein
MAKADLDEQLDKLNKHLLDRAARLIVPTRDRIAITIESAIINGDDS